MLHKLLNQFEAKEFTFGNRHKSNKLMANLYVLHIVNVETLLCLHLET